MILILNFWHYSKYDFKIYKIKFEIDKLRMLLAEFVKKLN
ncbi:hypothetical protein HCMG_00092 [Helicobacter canadensis MIT 98-5491]|nr:hypothetical protein HCMG_00092 [Helicobacter canadensis MIT 98-5491]